MLIFGILYSLPLHFSRPLCDLFFFFNFVHVSKMIFYDIFSYKKYLKKIIYKLIVKKLVSY